MNIKSRCWSVLVSWALGVACPTAGAQQNQWIWMSGGSTVGSTCNQPLGVCGQPGVFGSFGVPAAGNVPAGRNSAVGWTDPSGNLWLFGGVDFSSGYYALSNDLWEFSPATREWVWVSGGRPATYPGEYGALGVPGLLNVPGARFESSGWTDQNGNLWLFGGTGQISTNSGYLNDLWEFQPSTGAWTWVSGADKLTCFTVSGNYVCGTPGAYGTLGTPAATNVPGGRASAASWVDSNGNFWLFGGTSSSNIYWSGVWLNDLWRYDPSTGLWAWMSGSNNPGPSTGRTGVSGTLGQPSPANVPGGRYAAVSWSDSKGNLWLFGGFGWDASGHWGYLNDLWEFTPSSQEWTWMGGSIAVPTFGAGQPGVYGTLGTPAAGNIPGGRTSATTWVDANGNFWLFGGNGADSKGSLGYLNDIWEFNPTTLQWTWRGGSNTTGTCTKTGTTYCGPSGSYGILGTPAAANDPGGRYSANGWTDTGGNLWLFGGFGSDSSHAFGELNDLWVFQTASTSLPTATPIFGPAPGVYPSALSVSLSDLTPGAAIYYTTDGTTPTTTSTRYAGAITLSSTGAIEAVAVSPEYGPSAVGSGTYTIRPAVPSTTTLTATSGGSVVNSVNLGTPVTLVATVQAGGVAVTSGQVEFCDADATYCTDSHLLGTAQLTSAGNASLKFTPGIGSHNYNAVFVGIGQTVAPSSSGPAALTVTAAQFPTTTSLAQQDIAGRFTLTVTVNGSVYEPGLSTPTGAVSFVDTSNGNSVLGSAPLVAGIASMAWSNLQSLQTGSQPGAIAVADFNQDGIPDLAVANSGSNTVSIFLGKGDGTFTAVAASPSTGRAPVDLAAGDFNGDGIPDLAVVNYSDNSVTIFLGVGDGTFTAMRATLAVSSGCFAISVADFNGDGKADLAVAGQNVTILLGNGDGTFVTAPKSPGTGSYPDAMAVGDFNGDGKPDIVVIDGPGGAEGAARIFLGNGDGTFTAAASQDGGFEPESVAVGDFNGDGIADLAIAHAGGIRILLGNGGGTFTGSNISMGVENLWGIFVGDFNGDGIADLAVQDSDTNAATILIGKGDGTFVVAPGSASPAVGISPHSLAVGVFDADGIQDLVAANYDNRSGNGNQNTVSVLLARPMEPATATVTGITVSGPDYVVANYSGDSLYFPSVSSPKLLAPSVTVSSPSLAFSVAAGSSPSQQISLSSTTSVPWTASASAGWITLTPKSGTAPGSITVAVNTASLQPGAYSASFAISNPIASPAQETIPVSLTVTTGGIFVAPTTLNFQLQQGAPTQSQALQIEGKAGATWTATASAGGWLTVSPGTGQVPALLTALVNPGGLAPGTYQGTITIQPAAGLPSTTANVTLAVTPSNGQSGIITTAAGNGTAGFAGDGGPASLASLNGPGGVAVDGLGDFFMADSGNNVVRMVSVAGVITTIAGNGTAGYSGDGGPAVSAQLNGPVGLAVDASGNLFIADSFNNVVREVSANRTITTVAGNGGAGFGGDGGPATSAFLNVPLGVTLDASGDLFISDNGNGRIRMVPAGGAITTVAGGGNPADGLGDGGPAVSAQLNGPVGIALDALGDLFIADSGNSRIREVAAGAITTIAGNVTVGFSGDGGPAVSAQLNGPTGVAVDASGNLFVADSGNGRIREISPKGIITTAAGNGSGNSSGDGGPATLASLGGPLSVAVDASGDLFIGESGSSRIREVSAVASCTNVGGNWNASESGSANYSIIAPIESDSFTDPVSGSGSAIIAQTGCSIEYAPIGESGLIGTGLTPSQIASLNRTGTVSGNSVSIAGLSALIDTVSAAQAGLTITNVSSNLLTGSGQVAGNLMTVSETGSFAASGTYSISGQSGSFTLAVTTSSTASFKLVSGTQTAFEKRIPASPAGPRHPREMDLRIVPDPLILSAKPAGKENIAPLVRAALRRSLVFGLR